MPNDAPRWLQALPALFAIGAKIGGDQTVGTAALQGSMQANAMAEQERQQRTAEHQRQQQIDLQRQAAMERQQQLAVQEEQRRQQAIRASIDDLRPQKWPSKKEYDEAIGAHESMLTQFYGVRPNMLRAAVPYNGPTAESRARDVMEALTKQKNWNDIVEGDGLIKFDRDEDGIEEMVPVLEVAKLGKFPIAVDPQTQKPMLPPKEVKAENLQEWDEAYKNTLAQWKVEGKDINSPRVKLAAQQAANKLIAESKRTSDPTLEAIRQLTLAQAKQNATTKMYSPGQERAVNMLADDYARDSKDFAQRAQSYDTVIGAAKEPTAAGDLSLIFAYMKMLDPGSVVREGEFATAQNATGVPDRIRNLYNQVTQGVRLNPAQRADFVKQAGNIYSTAKMRQDRITGTYRQRAQRRGLDPNDVIVDYGATKEPGGGKFSVVAPNGKTYTFGSQEAADAFKASLKGAK
jgi:hypothetical protein